MKDAISAEGVAKQIGYTMPLSEFGLARWESDHGFAFVAASGNGDGGLDVQVGHRVKDTAEKIGMLTINAEGETQGFWLGEKNIDPCLILRNILSALEIMGSPVFVDSPELA